MSQAIEDAGFFQRIHQIGANPPEVRIDERRDRKRRKMSRVQLLAPYIEGVIPARSQFAEVRFRDISEQGFSYFTAIKPESDAVVVVLGDPPVSTYLTAVIAHCTSVGTEAKPKYLVGCRFTGRLAM